MKFKPMNVTNIEARQKVMHIDSDKETVLYAEEFKPEADSNNEYVIGLPLAVRDMETEQINVLGKTISEVFAKVNNGQTFAVAIHTKNHEDEVHFHISYNGEELDHSVVQGQFENISF